VTTAAIAKLSAKEGLPRLLQIAGWTLFGPCAWLVSDIQLLTKVQGSACSCPL
jgi:hypothetical protein